MVKYLIDIFCKDTNIGLCSIGLAKKSGTYKNMYPKKMFVKDCRKPAFNDSFSIDPIVCHL